MTTETTETGQTAAGGGRRPVRRALVSVYDKSGLDELARGLHEAGVALVSTGSTASRIASNGIDRLGPRACQIEQKVQRWSHPLCTATKLLTL